MELCKKKKKFVLILRKSSKLGVQTGVVYGIFIRIIN